MRAFAAVVVAVLAAGTACGGGGGSNNGAARRAITPSAQERAKAINLKLSDFPDGWRASTPSDEDKAGQKKFRKCIGVDLSKITLIGDANSRDFAKGDSANASSQARITEAASQATDGMKRVSRGLSSAAMKDCLRDAFDKAPSFNVGEIEVGELKSKPPSNVDAARAWEIVIPIEITSGEFKGLSSSAYIDIVYLRKGSVVASVTTSEVVSSLDDSLRAHLVRTVAKRMSESST
jgi:hypothetical protein